MLGIFGGFFWGGGWRGFFTSYDISLFVQHTCVIFFFLHKRFHVIKIPACLLVCSERQGASPANHFLCWVENYLLGSRLFMREGLRRDAFDWMFCWRYFV